MPVYKSFYVVSHLPTSHFNVMAILSKDYDNVNCQINAKCVSRDFLNLQ